MLAAALALPAGATEADVTPAPPSTVPGGLPPLKLPPLPWQKQQPQQAQQAQPQQQQQAAATLSPAEKQMREDQDRFNQTVFGGMLVGAAVGAGGAWIYSKIRKLDPRQTRDAALKGGVAGAVVGGVDGYVTAKKEQAGRQQVRELQAATADVRQDNDRLQAFIDSTNKVLAEGRARLAALSSDLAAKRVSTQDADKTRQHEQQNIDEMNTTLESAKKSRDQYRQAAAKLQGTPQERKDLDGEIKKMDKQVAQLEGNIAEYTRALQVSKA
jgi:hypothetical protein